MDNGVHNFLYWVDKQSQTILQQSRKSDPEKKTALLKSMRSPKCARCRNHGVVNNLKGHKYVCRWKSCMCQNCVIVKDKQKITASRVAKLRKQRKSLSKPYNIFDEVNHVKDKYDRNSTGSPDSASTTSSSVSDTYDPVISERESIPPRIHKQVQRVGFYQPSVTNAERSCAGCNMCRKISEETFMEKLKYLADMFPMCSIRTLRDALSRANGEVSLALKIL